MSFTQIGSDTSSLAYARSCAVLDNYIYIGGNNGRIHRYNTDGTGGIEVFRLNNPLHNTYAPISNLNSSINGLLAIESGGNVAFYFTCSREPGSVFCYSDGDAVTGPISSFSPSQDVGTIRAGLARDKFGNADYRYYLTNGDNIFGTNDDIDDASASWTLVVSLSSILTGSLEAASIAVAGDGGLLVAEANSDTLFKYADGAATVVSDDLHSGTLHPYGMDVDGNGYIWIGESFGGTRIFRSDEALAAIPPPPVNDSWVDLQHDDDAVSPDEYPSEVDGDAAFVPNSMGVLNGVVYVGLQYASDVVVLELTSDGTWLERARANGQITTGLSVVEEGGDAAVYYYNNGDGKIYRSEGGSVWSNQGRVSGVSVGNPNALAIDWSGNATHRNLIAASQVIYRAGDDYAFSLVAGSNIGTTIYALGIHGDGRPMAFDADRRLNAWNGSEWERLDGVDEVPGDKRIRGMGVDDDGRVYALVGNDRTDWLIYRSQTAFAAKPPVRPEASRLLTGEDLYYALEITHSDTALSGFPVRVVADSRDHSIDGDTYTSLAFRAVPPNFRDGEEPQAILEIDNVGKVLTDLIEESKGGRGAKLKVMQVRRGKNESEVVWELPALPVGVTSVTAQSVQLSLAYRSGRHRPGIKWRHTHVVSPGLY